jgi:magnesium chelatase family protein
MHAAIHSIIETGLSGVVIDVECRLSNGLPAIVIVGYASKSIEEAKERIRGAFSSSQLQLPRKRIVLNLAPGDIPKQGTCFDLAMAAAILVAQGNIKFTLKNWMIIGELSLDGSVRPVRGIIGQIQAGRQLGYKKFLIPSKNLPQAQLVDGVSLFPVQDLLQLHAYLLGRVLVANRSTVAHSPVPRPHYPVDMQDIRGQRQAKRALEIAAAGGHNLLLSGPPGAGKSLLAQALPSILPLPTAEEVMTITHLHSLTSHQFSQINSRRPFRSPHHSISYNALVGGGQLAQPGEISLSHGGVLFLDELPEFNRAAIEALRQPLENKSITVSRAHQKVDYPANFTLVATANPCPCG